MIYIEYENMPKFCKQCASIGHNMNSCKFLNREDARQSEGRHNLKPTGREVRQQQQRRDVEQQEQPHIANEA